MQRVFLWGEGIRPKTVANKNDIFNYRINYKVKFVGN